MKILTINHSDKLVGGSDVYWRNINSLLEYYGNTVVKYFSSNTIDEMPKDISLNELKLANSIKFFYNLEAKRKLENILNENMVDVAHLNIFYGKLSVSIIDALKSYNVPIVQTLHEYKVCCPVYTMSRDGNLCFSCRHLRYYNCFLARCNRKSLLRSLISTLDQYFFHLRGTLTKIDHFICVSEFQKSLIQKMNPAIKNITVLHNFLPIDKFENTYVEGNYYLYFGRIEKIKGVGNLIKAVAYLRDKFDLIIPLKIIGDGSYLVETKNMVSHLKLSNIEFIPKVSHDKIVKYISNSKCTITPSIWGETFGLTVIESMALSKPVIVSNIGGLNEIVDDYSTGLKFDYNDYKDLAYKIRYLESNPHNVSKFGKNGRVKVENCFSDIKHYQSLVSIYKKVICGCANR